MLLCPLSFDQLKPGPISNTCCFVLVKGLFFKDGILNFVIHKFELQGSKTLSQLISNYGHDMQEFAEHVFVFEPIVVNESQISLLPLCQIYGPKIHSWGVDHNISCKKDGNFLQCSLQPNWWNTHYLNQDTADRYPFLKTPQVQWINKQKPVGESNDGCRCKKR